MKKYDTCNTINTMTLYNNGRIIDVPYDVNCGFHVLFLGLKDFNFMHLILSFELSANLLSHHHLVPLFQSIEELEDFIFVELYEPHFNLLIDLLQLFLTFFLHATNFV